MHKYRNLLFAILGIKVVFILGMLIFYRIPLAPDEAQYWVWSHHLSWGYYSKPPGIAWLIALTTPFFGNNEVGVRFGSIGCAFGIGMAIYYLGLRLRLTSKAAFWAAVIAAFTPWGFYLSIAATTDAPSILFLTCALVLLLRGIDDKEIPYVKIGLLLLCGVLFKWTVLCFWPLLWVVSYFFPSLRKEREGLWLGVLISLVGFLPSLLWNMKHQFVTFKHVWFSLFSHGSHRWIGNFPSFVGAQIGLLSPLFFGIAVFAVIHILLNYRKNIHLALLVAYPITLALVIMASFIKTMPANWGIFLFSPIFVIMSWFLWKKHQGNTERWLYAGLLISIVSVASLFFIPAAQNHNLFRWMKIPYSMNPLRQNVGVDQLGWLVRQSSFDRERDFLFADTYQTTSHLHMYAPYTKRIYWFNMRNHRKNQYSFMQSIQQEEGNRGYFVAVEHMDATQQEFYKEYYVSLLKPFFASVTVETLYPVYYVYGEPVKYVIVLRCERYNGIRPAESTTF